MRVRTYKGTSEVGLVSNLMDGSSPPAGPCCPELSGRPTAKSPFAPYTSPTNGERDRGLGGGIPSMDSADSSGLISEHEPTTIPPHRSQPYDRARHDHLQRHSRPNHLRFPQ